MVEIVGYTVLGIASIILAIIILAVCVHVAMRASEVVNDKIDIWWRRIFK